MCIDVPMQLTVEVAADAGVGSANIAPVVRSRASRNARQSFARTIENTLNIIDTPLV